MLERDSSNLEVETVPSHQSLTPDQAQAAEAPGNVVVIAGAGTGKTHMLAERYHFHVCQQGLSPLNVVAVTFTDKAADQLRSRIRRRLKAELHETPNHFNTLAELEAAPISTLHALAADICREHPEAAGVPPDFEIQDGLSSQLWLAEHLPLALDSLPPALFTAIPYSPLRDSLAQLLKEPWISDRAFEQSPDDEALVAQMQIQAHEQLLRDPAWTEAIATLQHYSGSPQDKLEASRQTALAAVDQIQQGQELAAAAAATLAAIKPNSGSSKNWPDGALQTIREALKVLRERVKQAQQAGAFGRELGEADHLLMAYRPLLREAYERVRDELRQRQRQARQLSFAESEGGALRALEQPEVRDYYHQRWRAFLIDEFQDTNPTQAELIDRLTAGATLTIVGDRQQAIYGFRQADVRVFDQFRHQIVTAGGTEVTLRESFRARPRLNTLLNSLSGPLLGPSHQPLLATRTDWQDLIHPVQALVVTADGPKLGVGARRVVEARAVADRLRAALAAGWPVGTGQPLQPGDIAVLSRTWESLELHATVLAAAGLPVALAGGSNLLATREAKDGWALLRAIADPEDDLALIATLRSSFFTVSDRSLWPLAPKLDPGPAGWWSRLQASDRQDIQSAIAVLQTLQDHSTQDRPSRLLQQADRLTGYTAVVANLPGGDRRLADWQGFRDLVQRLETQAGDLFSVLRQLQRLFASGQELPRPPLAAGNAITLTTIHGAKGLEWPLVAVVDLARQPPSASPPVYSDRTAGVAFQIQQAGEILEPFRYRHLKQQAAAREQEERRRLLYVALTRAQDYLLLSAPEAKHQWSQLTPGLEAAGVVVEPIPYQPQQSLVPEPPPPIPPDSLPPLLLAAVGSGLSELPVTALNTYARCPRRFQYEILDGHPGLGPEPREGEGVTGTSRALALGSLTHEILAADLSTLAQAEALARQHAASDCVAQAWDLAQTFRQEPQFAPFRGEGVAREQWLSLVVAGVTLIGQADRVGPDWVLDYKTDRTPDPQAYRWQLWAYARALEVSTAHLAYLRPPAQLHTFTSADLAAMTPAVEALVRSLRQGPYPPQPGPAQCRSCPYLTLCEAGQAAIST